MVLEGAEGVGKTTQARHLAAALRAAGEVVSACREPGDTPVGEQVRALLLDPGLSPTPAAEALLFLASRAELLQRVVRPALARGEIVVLDRFFLSTYAYQIAGRGLAPDPVRAANQLAVAGVVPDLTLVLELPGDEGMARAAQRHGAGASASRDRMEQADAAFHERVRAAFRGYADPAWQRAHPECGAIVAIDASGDEASVTRRIVAAVSAHLARGRTG